MASDAVDTSHGATIAFGTSGFSAQVLGITPPGLTRDSVDTSYQETEDAKTHIPVDLYDSGELGFDIHFNPDTEPPMGGANETITLTFPSGATWEFSGHMSGYAPDMPHLDKMTARVTVKVSGTITTTAG